MKEQPASVMVVDDEKPGRDLLVALIQADDRFEVSGQAASGKKAICQFERLRPDVLFLDIQMPGMDGFMVCREIDLTSTVLVFVTAYMDYALQAFDVRAVDYVTKPIRIDRFHQTLDHVAELVNNKRARAQSDELRGLSTDRRSLHTTSGELVFDPREVLFLESSGNYVKLQLVNECHLVRTTLKDIADLFDPRQFIAVHRCYIINTAWIRKVVKAEGRGLEILLKNTTTRIPVSRTRRDIVNQLITSLNLQ